VRLVVACGGKRTDVHMNDNEVFIKNVSYDADSTEVAAAFNAAIGGVVRVHLLRSQSGGTSHAGSGFVHFDNPNYAALALNETIWVRGRRIFIEPLRQDARPPKAATARKT
jgi:hypothetical protein